MKQYHPTIDHVSIIGSSTLSCTFLVRTPRGLYTYLASAIQSTQTVVGMIHTQYNGVGPGVSGKCIQFLQRPEMVIAYDYDPHE